MKEVHANSVKYSSWEADGRLISQEISRLSESEVLPCSHEPATGPYPEPAELSPHPHTGFPLRSIWMLYSFFALILRAVHSL
jgi:hypothetical protein